MERREIGSRLELFVDDWLIDRFDGATLRLHSLSKQPEQFAFDAPWEGPNSHYPAVLAVGSEYRLYYRGWRGRGHPAFTCVARSSDGVNWERLRLGHYEWQGSRDNNIVWDGEYAHTFAPFLDTNPASSDNERFKAMAAPRVAAPADIPRGLMRFGSPDGLRWHQVDQTPVITDGMFDSQNVAFWDAKRGHYAAYYRAFLRGDNKTGIRSVKTATSPDFVQWTEGRFLDFGDAPLEHLYTNATIPYSRAPHIYLAFPKRFVPHRQRFTAATFPGVALQRGVSDGVFMSSRDGLRWDRRFMEAFLRPGRDRENWTDRSNGFVWGVLHTRPDELSLYWVEHVHHPTSRLRRGTLRVDGFVSINAGYQGGEVLTRPLRFDGQELVLNYATSAVGSIRVEVHDADGHAIPGFTLDQCDDIYGDEIEGVVRWEGRSSVAQLSAAPVRLRLTLRDADVYSLQFRPIQTTRATGDAR